MTMFTKCQRFRPGDMALVNSASLQPQLVNRKVKIEAVLGFGCYEENPTHYEAIYVVSCLDIDQTNAYQFGDGSLRKVNDLNEVTRWENCVWQPTKGEKNGSEP